MLLANVPAQRPQEMASKTDRDLRREISYLTKLIDSHKRASVVGSQSKPKPTTEASRFKWTATTARETGSAQMAPVVSKNVRTTNSLRLSPRSTGTVSPGSSTTLSRHHSSHHPPSRNKYHYGNHYRRSNQTQSTRRPSDRRPGNRKWGNMVYTPTVGAPKISATASSGAASVSSGEPDQAAGAGERSRPSPAPSSSLSSTKVSSSPSAAGSALTKAGTTSVKPPPRGRFKWPHNSPTGVASTKPHPAPKASAVPLTTPPNTVATPTNSRGGHAPCRIGSTSRSSRYRWRRRSTPSSSASMKKPPVTRSPGPRSPSRAAGFKPRPPHTPSWVIHNKYKLTHASIVHKYSKIMQRQRSSRTMAKPSRSVGRRKPSQSSLKSSKSRNKVWRASDHSSSGSLAKTGVVLWPIPSRRLSGGRELKTRQGNRQWVARRPGGALPTPSRGGERGGAFLLRRLSGHELKTRHGNRQWVARRVAVRRTLQSAAVNRQRSLARGLAHPGRVGRSMQLVNMSGQKFVVDSGGRRMKRLVSLSSSSPAGAASSSPLQRLRLRSRGRSLGESPFSYSVKQLLASRAVQRSRVYVWSAKQRQKREAKKYCIFYNRFGKCNRGDGCQYIHDPGKIAVCTKFLRGMCDKTDGSCLFSHTLSKDKMPTCVYFLRGVCTREVCPYRHVSVGRHAEVCLDFARGYCPSGEQCSKRHIVDCPEFSEEGRCRRGDKCLLRHRKKTAVPTATGCPVAPPTTETPPTKTPLAFRRLRRQRLVPESVDSGMGPVEGDDGDGAADEDSCDDHRLSPLDPSCPAPDFLSL